MEKLTEAQREEAIGVIIEDMMETLYKPRDQFQLFYEGCTPFKDMKDQEIIDWFKEQEKELPWAKA